MNTALKIERAYASSPRYIQTQNGIVVDASQDIWKYQDKLVDIKLDFLALPVSEQIRKSIKSTFTWFAENESPDYLRNILTYLSYLLTYIHTSSGNIVSEISDEMLISYHSSLIDNTKYHLGFIRNFLRKWHEFSLPGISSEAIEFLYSIKLPGNPKGEAVRTMLPTRGPFSDIEFQNINSALRKAFYKGKIALGDFLLIWLFMVKGNRPRQYAALRVSDFTITRNSYGDKTYLLNVPRAKQRGKFARDLFKINKIIPEIGIMFERYTNQLNPLTRDIPLFPRKRQRKHAPEGYQRHHTSQTISAHLKYVLKSLNIISERTNEPLKVNAQRFRYTLGSRMALEGHPILVIAEALDHTNIDNVRVYVENSPQIIKQIDAATETAIKPLADIFLGKIVKDESEATLGKNASSRICDPRFDSTMKPMGSCSQVNGCGVMAPLNCYLCEDFQAWLDGPHKAVLAYLLEERKRLEKDDLRIAANYDSLILAVHDVVNRCERLKAGILEGQHG